MSTPWTFQFLAYLIRREGAGTTRKRESGEERGKDDRYGRRERDRGKSEERMRKRESG